MANLDPIDIQISFLPVGLSDLALKVLETSEAYLQDVTSADKRDSFAEAARAFTSAGTSLAIIQAAVVIGIGVGRGVLRFDPEEGGEPR
jgi:hypothetical protein